MTSCIVACDSGEATRKRATDALFLIEANSSKKVKKRAKRKMVEMAHVMRKLFVSHRYTKRNVSLENRYSICRHIHTRGDWWLLFILFFFILFFVVLFRAIRIWNEYEQYTRTQVLCGWGLIIHWISIRQHRGRRLWVGHSIPSIFHQPVGEWEVVFFYYFVQGSLVFQCTKFRRGTPLRSQWIHRGLNDLHGVDMKNM